MVTFQTKLGLKVRFWKQVQISREGGRLFLEVKNEWKKQNAGFLDKTNQKVSILRRLAWNVTTLDNFIKIGTVV